MKNLVQNNGRDHKEFVGLETCEVYNYARLVDLADTAKCCSGADSVERSLKSRTRTDHDQLNSTMAVETPQSKCLLQSELLLLKRCNH